MYGLPKLHNRLPQPGVVGCLLLLAELTAGVLNNFPAPLPSPCTGLTSFSPHVLNLQSTSFLQPVPSRKTPPAPPSLSSTTPRAPAHRVSQVQQLEQAPTLLPHLPRLLDPKVPGDVSQPKGVARNDRAASGVSQPQLWVLHQPGRGETGG